MEEKRIKAPGLKWPKRKNGRVPYWIADENDVKAGYRPKSVNLSYIADQPEILRAKCEALQADMLLWRAGYRNDPLDFDGTFKSLLTTYQVHEESPFHALKPGSLVPYVHYLGALEGHIGKRRVDTTTGVDFIRWHRVWSSQGKHLAASSTARSVLAAALSFGVMLRLDGCPELLTILRETNKDLPAPKRRTAKMTARQVTAARRAAHAAGRHSAALAYAIAFETTLRLWDVIGQWWAIEQGGMSDVLDDSDRLKWFRLKWEDIGPDMVLRYTPSKTMDTSEAQIAYPLAKAPMVLEELEHWPAECRTGPVIVNEKTGRPYRTASFTGYWSRDRKAAGIPHNVWARDLRASGISEGRAADVSIDDVHEVSGHTNAGTTRDVYDRAVLEAADRFADKRVKGHNQAEQ